MGAAEGQSVERDVENPVVPPRHFQGLRRPIARLGGPPLREQQIAVPIPSQRVQQRDIRLRLLLPPLGVGEQICRLFPFAGGMERVGVGRAAGHHLRRIAAAIRKRDGLFRRRHGSGDFANKQFGFAQI